MYSHKIYIVASTERSRDVNIIDVFDSRVFTIDSIVAGLKDKLKGQKYQVSMYGDNAYIDIIDSQDELIQTYSIVSKVAKLVMD